VAKTSEINVDMIVDSCSETQKIFAGCSKRAQRRGARSSATKAMGLFRRPA